MASINPKEFLDELIFCLKEEDLVKAKALLQFASDADVQADVQKQALSELSRAPESVVFPLLEHLTRLDIANPEIQEALYDLILDKAYGNTPLVIKYITQNNRKNRLIYIRAAGDLMLYETAPALKALLGKTNDTEILVQTARSLGALRLKDSFPALLSLAREAADTVRHAAIFAMADIGGKEAVDLLKESITGAHESDLMAVEALAGIQDQYALDTLASLLASRHSHVRDAAIDQLIEIGNKSVPILTRAASNAESDYMVHLITTLGYIGDQAAVPVIIDIINLKPKDPNIRQAAYEALERIPSPKSAISLAIGLQDSVEAVRMSAARAVDRNLSRVLVAGLKNIVRESSQDSRKTVAALIDAEADNIFNFLLDEPSFIQLAQDHITSSADASTRDHFLNLLKSKNRGDLADSMASKVPALKPNTKDSSPVIFVIDDSKMMLKLYQNKLINLGYNPTLFQFPEEAIAAVHVTRPDLVITDLNMPKVNGIQLTREIRKKYSRQELPILMITTQSDFIELETGSGTTKVDDAFLGKSGINKVLHKPFTDEALKQSISQYLGS
ncbi:MAG: HEAT repeat domain-containing protein [Pseudomonadota bacterium]